MALPYSEIVQVDDTTYPIDAQITVPFATREIAVVIMDGTATNTADVSFDGVHTHARLVPTQLGGFAFDIDAATTPSQIWFRSPNAVSVQVIATPR